MCFSQDVVVVVDPDCLFVGKLDIPVEEGSPIAQQAFYHFDFSRRDDAAIEARPAPSSHQTQGACNQPATALPIPPRKWGFGP